MNVLPWWLVTFGVCMTGFHILIALYGLWQAIKKERENGEA